MRPPADLEAAGSECLAAALEYARRGWRVFPVHRGMGAPGGKRMCTCTLKSECASPGKHPACENGVLDATTDEAQIRLWWRTPFLQVAIALGPESGIFAIDVDPRHGGVKPEAAPETFTVRTGGHPDGRHFFYRWPSEAVMPASAWPKHLAPGVDLQGAGRYVVAAPSCHVSNERYEILDAREPVSGDWLSSALDLRLAGADQTDHFRGLLEQSVAAVQLAEPGTRNETLNRETFRVLANVGGLPLRDEAVERLAGAARIAGLGDTEIERTLGSASRGASAIAPKSRPRIVVSRELAEMIKEAGNALSANPGGLYRQGSRLVHLERTMGRLVIAGTAMPVLRGVLDEVADWIKVTKDGASREMPPKDVNEAVFNRLPALPELQGVLNCPTLRPDGSLLQAPGYDEASRLYLDRPLPVSVPDAPSEAQALAALATIDDVLADFPFASPQDHAGALAAVLTAVCRGAVAGPVPLFAISSPTAGTGKGLLANVVATIAQGPGRLQPMGVPPTAEEWYKAVLAILRSGDPVALLDNATGSVQSDAFESVLTAWPEYRARKLGVSDVAVAPSSTLWILTGNNYRLDGDLYRRTIPIRLESTDERPEARSEWRHPRLLRHIVESRSKIVSAALCVVRAHLTNPCALETRVMGSYESWSDVIRSAVVRFFGFDPVEGQDALREEGSASLVRELLRCLREKYADAFFSAGDVVSWALGASDGLAVVARGCLDDLGVEEIKPRPVGMRLETLRDQIHTSQGEKLILRRSPVRSQTGWKWRVDVAE